MRMAFTMVTGRWLLLGSALLQLASPVLIGFEQDGWEDPVVVPPGSFFGIWSLITAGCVAAAVWGLPRRRAASMPYRAVQGPVSVAQLLFGAWLVAADTVPVLTVPVFVAMVAVLTHALRIVVATPTDRLTRLLLGGTLGLYTGWSTTAVWLNVATLLPVEVRANQAVLTAFLIGAAVAGVAGALLFRGSPGFVAAAAWAFTGILVSTVQEDAPGLAGVAAVGLVAVLVTGVVARLRSGALSSEAAGQRHR